MYSVYLQASYKKEHEESKASNKFNVVDTDQYKTSKDLENRFSEVKVLRGVCLILEPRLSANVSSEHT